MLLGTFLRNRTAILRTLRGQVDRISDSTSLRRAGLFAFLVVSYVVSGRFGVQIAGHGTHTTLLWPPAGISLAALLILGLRFWPAIFLGAFVVNLTLTHEVFVSFGIAAGNTLEGLVGADLVRHYAQGTKAFFHTKGVVRFVLFAGVLATAMSASIGVSLLCGSGFSNWKDFLPVWLTWWEGDAMASLVLAPFLVLLLGNQHHPLQWREWGELLALLVGLTATSVWVLGAPAFHSANAGLLVALCVPFSLWAAHRFCPLEASGANLILCGFVIWSSLAGQGPFASGKEGPLLLGLFVTVTTSTALVISAFQYQRRSREEDLTVAIGLYKSANDELAANLTKTAESLNMELAEHLVARRVLEQHRQKINEIVHESPRIIWVTDRANRLVHYVDPFFKDALDKSWERLCNNPTQHVGPLEVAIHPAARALGIPATPPTNLLLSQLQHQVIGRDGALIRTHEVTYLVAGHSDNPDRCESVSIEVAAPARHGQKEWPAPEQVHSKKVDGRKLASPHRFASPGRPEESRRRLGQK
jgi:integral membrane sensor domain MASE1